MMPYKVAFVSLGCAKNLVNTEQMMALCRDAGHTVTGGRRPHRHRRPGGGRRGGAEHLRLY